MWSWAFAVWLHKCLFPANAKPELTKWCARTVWSDHQVLTAHTVLYVKNRQQNGPSCIYFFCSLYISALWLCLSLGPFSGLKIISNHLSHIQYVPSKGVSPSFIDLSLFFSPLSLSDSVNLHTKKCWPYCWRSTSSCQHFCPHVSACTSRHSHSQSAGQGTDLRESRLCFNCARARQRPKSISAMSEICSFTEQLVRPWLLLT